MEPYVDTSRVNVRPIPKSIARKIIVENHYTHKFRDSDGVTLGVYYRTDNSHRFFDEDVEELIGAVTYGFPVGRRVIGSIFTEDVLENKNILELTRLFIFDGYGKNIESYVISQSFRWLKEHKPNIKILVSYADPEQGHDGAIYQATNWIYQGAGEFQLAPTYSLRLSEDGDWMHSRSVYSKFGSADPKKLVKSIGHDFWLKEEASKHRYIYFLCSKSSKRKYMKVLKHPIRDYPKNYEHKKNIRKIEVENNKWQ
tara:strand:- start:361 stop:1125 length:765 start_codon:yes stop_codon:yes gene_type:complete